MNKNIGFFLIALAAFSCKKVGNDPDNVGGTVPPEDKFISVKAVLPDDNDALNLSFSRTSSMVVNSARSQKVELDSDGDGKIAVFSYKEGTVAPFSAIYPASVYSSMENITIPARQKYVAGGVDAASAIMLGYASSGNEIRLNHAMAYLRLTVNPGSLGSDNIYEITISGTNGEQLSGDFKPDCKSGTLSPLSRSSSVIVRAGGSGIPMGSPVIVALPPRNSIKLNYNITDVNAASLSIKDETQLRLAAGKVTDVPLVFEQEEGSAKITLTPYTGLNAAGSVSSDHAGLESRSSLVQMKSSLTEYNNDYNLPKRPTYSRVRRLPNGKYLLMWQRGSESRTDNNGQDTFYAIGNDISNFEYKGVLFGHKDVPGCKGGTVTRFYTCPELLVLKNGDLLAANSFWVPTTYNLEAYKKDHGLAIKRSSDNGLTWSDEQVIFYAQCWEPFLMEMPDGQIHCYFTEARPWISSSHSGTSLVLSKDGGKNWEPALGEEPYRVMRKTWCHEASSMYKYTDQMPVGINIGGSGKLAFAMEDVDSESSAGTSHSVSVVYSPGAPGWTYLSGEETGPSDRSDNLGPDACAPYLIQFPSGETILSYSRERGTWPYCYKMGNASARSFGAEKTALSMAGNWSSTCLDGSHCMLVASAYSNAIHLCRFALNHDITATLRKVEIDGNNSEWAKTDEALYFCKDASQDATLRCSSDADNVYLLVEVSNVKLSASDYITLFVGPESASGSLDGALAVKVGPGGLLSSNAAISAKSVYSGTLTDDNDIDTGYFAEVAIPRSALKLKSDKITLGASFSSSAPTGVLCKL